MAKKETTAKKAETKKKSSTKKPATKKQTKKVTKVTEEQLPKIAEELQEQTVIETVDLEKFKDEKGEYDLTNATEEEVKSAINQLEDDDKIFVVKNEGQPILETLSEPEYIPTAEEVNKILDVVNGDPAVLGPVEPTKEEQETADKESVEKIKKEAENSKPIVVEKKESKVNKIIKKFNQNFGYLWNGQMIDF